MINIWHAMIGSLPFSWAQYEFMRQALLAVLLMSPLFALLGCMVINNHLAFFSEAMGHAALTGIAIGAVTGLVSATGSMMGFGVLLAILVCVLRRYSAASADTIIGLVMAFTVALGVVMLSRGGGFAKYSRFLIGDVLTISPAEIGRLVLLLVLVLGSLFFFFNRIFVVSLNQTLARSRGLRTGLIEGFFMALVALVVMQECPNPGVSISWKELVKDCGERARRFD